MAQRIKLMLQRSVLLAAILFIVFPLLASPPSELFLPDRPEFQYVGRIDRTNPLLPKFSAPGAYVRANFSGSSCEILLNDEELWGKYHNYVTVVIDNGTPQRIKLTQKQNVLKFDNLKGSRHSILICKSTESGIGYIEFAGLSCRAILPPPNPMVRRIEFIGNSITSGMGSDETSVKCDQGEWYDQHNAYLAYGPITARSLNSDWMLTSVSGIGLIRSCCDMTITMPGVYDKMNQRDNHGQWDFSKYTPDVVTVCLGQNDGIQDSTKFCGAYVDFVTVIRNKYPGASIVLLTSPMGDEKLTKALTNYLDSVVEEVRSKGDENISFYSFSKRYHKGCGDHPDLKEHEQISGELTMYLKQLMKW